MGNDMCAREMEKGRVLSGWACNQLRSSTGNLNFEYIGEVAAYNIACSI